MCGAFFRTFFVFPDNLLEEPVSTKGTHTFDYRASLRDAWHKVNFNDFNSKARKPVVYSYIWVSRK